MANLSIQSKEQLIIGTILSCNNEIRKFSKLIGLKESSKINMYHYNMVQLFGEINPLFENNFELSKIPEESIFIKNNHDNYYAYFQKVNDFLEGYETNIQQNLNESLIVDELKINNPIQININTFKDDLKNIINILLKKDDLENLSSDVLKIKTFAKKPILIYGFDICNNPALQKDLVERFNLTMDKLISICFDKSNKQLLFIPNNTGNIIAYDIKEDIFDYYNKVNFGNQIVSQKLTAKDYLFQIKDLIHNNIIELYFNINLLDLKFGNNLYGDELRFESNAKFEKDKAIFEQSKSLFKK